MRASMSRTVVITALLVAVSAGCAAAPSPKQSPTATPSPQAGQVGHKFTVSGKGGSKYDVTLVSVAQPAQPATQFDSAKAGHHLDLGLEPQWLGVHEQAVHVEQHRR